MKVKKLFVTASMLVLLLTGVPWAEESVLSISGMKVEPSTVGSGSMVLISCQVTHSDGPMNIERVASTVSSGNLNSSYPMLYDDGTNGDIVAEDGIYSLEITAGNTPGEAKIIFIAVDTEQNEIESAPVTLTIQ
ncbi:MAG: choice-of-anchor X domain-containing protein [Thermodesulfobacteriota bacterium]|nr:choice-of-anchor X domain-containing protein [Thermodesulfobacteriota bacterium]